MKNDEIKNDEIKNEEVENEEVGFLTKLKYGIRDFTESKAGRLIGGIVCGMVGFGAACLMVNSARSNSDEYDEYEEVESEVESEE